MPSIKLSCLVNQGGIVSPGIQSLVAFLSGPQRNINPQFREGTCQPGSFPVSKLRLGNKPVLPCRRGPKSPIDPVPPLCVKQTSGGRRWCRCEARGRCKVQSTRAAPTGLVEKADRCKYWLLQAEWLDAKSPPSPSWPHYPCPQDPMSLSPAKGRVAG